MKDRNALMLSIIGTVGYLLAACVLALATLAAGIFLLLFTDVPGALSPLGAPYLRVVFLAGLLLICLLMFLQWYSYFRKRFSAVLWLSLPGIAAGGFFGLELLRGLLSGSV